MSDHNTFIAITMMCGIFTIASAVRGEWSSLGFVGIGIISILHS